MFKFKVTLVRATVALLLGLFWLWCVDMIGLAWPIAAVVGLVVASLVFTILNLVAVGREPERWEDLV